MYLESDRAGKMVKNIRGYASFVPNKLPPRPPIQIDGEMQKLLSLADRKLGRLDGITQVLPNPELFIAMYVKKEAVLSAQIEGTQASLADVLNAPSSGKMMDTPSNDVLEVVNYVKAIYWGLEELKTLPLSLRLIRNIHAVLLEGVRGSNKSPGEFRRSQNWIGTPGCTIETATFVPPAVEEMQEALADLEKFIHSEDDIPALIKIAIIHAQFETIHPFLDGNGRMGRLLITFWLCEQQILSKPLLYLSYYFKMNRLEYYDRLTAVRTKGDWENWIKFFLRGVSVVSDESIESASKIIGLRNSCTELLQKESGNTFYIAMLDHLFENPYVTRKSIAEALNVSMPTAGTLIDTFCKLQILKDISPDKKRYKSYAFAQYLEILEKGTELETNR